MNFRILEYFLMVAREENITKAAQILHISQPTLSRQLMQLEEELKVKLFQRSKHNIYLTNEGMLFRRRANELVLLAEKVKRELVQSGETITGEIYIGCGEFLSCNELARIIAAFQEKYPLVKVHIHSSYNNDIREWLEEGILDMGLLIEPIDISKYEFVRMKQKETWGVLVKEDSPMAELDAIRPGDLVGTPLVTVRDENVHNELASWSGDYASQMIPVVTYNLLYNAAMMVRQGIGAAVCIKLDCKYEGLKFLPMLPKLELSSVLVWREHRTYSAAVKAFIQFVKLFDK